MVEDQGIPNWVTYVIFGIATVTLGGLIGVVSRILTSTVIVLYLNILTFAVIGTHHREHHWPS